MRHIPRLSSMLALLVIGAATVFPVDAAEPLDQRKRELLETSLMKQGQTLSRPVLMDSAQRAAAITGLTFTDDPDRPALAIQVEGDAPYTWFHLNDGKRFVLDLHNTINLESGRVIKTESQSAVREVRTSLFAFEPQFVSRVVVEASAPLQPAFVKENGLLRVELTVNGSSESSRLATLLDLQEQEVLAAKSRMAEAGRRAAAERDRMDVRLSAVSTSGKESLSSVETEFEKQFASISKMLDETASLALDRVAACKSKADEIESRMASGQVTESAGADALRALREGALAEHKKTVGALKSHDRALKVATDRLSNKLDIIAKNVETSTEFATTEPVLASLDIEKVEVAPDAQASIHVDMTVMGPPAPMQMAAAAVPYGPWIPLSAAGEQQPQTDEEKKEFDSMRSLFDSLNEGDQGVAAPAPEGEPAPVDDPAPTEDSAPDNSKTDVVAPAPTIVEPAPADRAPDAEPEVKVAPEAAPQSTQPVDEQPAPEAPAADAPSAPVEAAPVIAEEPVVAAVDTETQAPEAETVEAAAPQSDTATPADESAAAEPAAVEETPSEEAAAPESPTPVSEPSGLRVEMNVEPSAPAAPPATPAASAPIVMPAVVQSEGSRDALDTIVDVVDFRDMDLKEVVPLLAEAANVNVIAGADVVGTVNFRARNVTLRQALETVLNINNLGLVEDKGIFRVVPRADALAAHRVTRMVPLVNGKAEAVKQTLDAVVIGSPDAELVTVAANAATNVIVLAGVKDRVDEFEQLVRQLDVTEPELPTATEALKLNYLDPTEAKTIVTSMLTPEIGKSEADVRGRHIIVTDQPMVVEQIRAVLKSIDTPTKQVSIEAMIIDAILRDSAQTGVDWTIEALRRFSTNGDLVSDVSQLQFDGNLGNVGSGDLDAGILTLGLLTSEVRVQAAIAAEVANNNAQILANPSVVTLENKPATISIVQEFPYQEITQGLTGPPVASTEFKPIGVSLDVTPAVTHDNDIIVEILAKQSSVSGVTDTGVPIEDKREADTTLRTQNGQTVFIGGLRRIDDVLGVSKVPVLGDIPVINFMFRNTTSEKTNTELLIFLTCNVKEPALPNLTTTEQYEYDKLDATPKVPDAQRQMYKDYVKPHTTRDPLWKWRRTN
ncbi:MAG: hypothetical protein AMXMBFR84_37040 [Candidatus Hydrogenedentota bacterium]